MRRHSFRIAPRYEVLVVLCMKYEALFVSTSRYNLHVHCCIVTTMQQCTGAIVARVAFSFREEQRGGVLTSILKF